MRQSEASKHDKDVAVDAQWRNRYISRSTSPMCSGVQAEDEAPLVRAPERSVGDQGQKLGVCGGPAERTGAN